MNYKKIRAFIGVALFAMAITTTATFSLVKHDGKDESQNQTNSSLTSKENAQTQKRAVDLKTIVDGELSFEYDANLLIPLEDNAEDYEFLNIYKRRQELETLLRRIPNAQTNGPIQDLRAQTIDALSEVIYRDLIKTNNGGSPQFVIQNIEINFTRLAQYGQVEILNRLAESDVPEFRTAAQRTLFFARLNKENETPTKEAFANLWAELIEQIARETDDLLLKNQLYATLETFDKTKLYTEEEIEKMKKEAKNAIEKSSKPNVRRLRYLEKLS